MARVLLYTSPAPGHIYPPIGTVTALRERGHEVAIRTAAPSVDSLAQLGFSVGAIDPRIEAVQPGDWKARTPIGAIRALLETFDARARYEVGDLQRAIDEERPDAILVDASATGAATLAEAQETPWAHYIPHPHPTQARGVPAFGPGFAPSTSPLARLRDEATDRLKKAAYASALTRLNARRRDLGLPPLHRYEEFVLRAPLAIQFSAEPFEYPRAWPENVLLVGPALWELPSQEPDWLAAEERPIVLVNASTDFQDDAVLIETALEAFADRPYLLVATTAAHDAGAVQRPGERDRGEIHRARADPPPRRRRRSPTAAWAPPRRPSPPASRFASSPSCATSSRSRAGLSTAAPGRCCPRGACAPTACAEPSRGRSRSGRVPNASGTPSGAPAEPMLRRRRWRGSWTKRRTAARPRRRSRPHPVLYDTEGISRPQDHRLPYMPGIDALRALAVLAVFLYHAGVGWMPGGFLGVDVFFVISGYLITSLLLAEYRRGGHIRLGRFWVRRARRLLPAVGVLIAVTMVVAAIAEPDRIDALRGDAIASLFYVANWHFIFDHQSYFEQFQRPSLFRHLWSLSVEEQFYLFWPLVFAAGMKLFGRTRLLVGVLAGALASVALAWILFDPTTPPASTTAPTPTPSASCSASPWRSSGAPGTCAAAHQGAGPGRCSTRVGVLALGYVVLCFIGVHDYDLGLFHGGYLWLAAATAIADRGLRPPGGAPRQPARPAARDLARAAQLQLLPLALAGAGADPAGDRRLGSTGHPDPAAARRRPRPRRRSPTASSRCRSDAGRRGGPSPPDGSATGGRRCWSRSPPSSS